MCANFPDYAALLMLEMKLSFSMIYIHRGHMKHHLTFVDGTNYRSDVDYLKIQLVWVCLQRNWAQAHLQDTVNDHD